MSRMPQEAYVTQHNMYATYDTNSICHVHTICMSHICVKGAQCCAKTGCIPSLWAFYTNINKLSYYCR